MRLSDNQDDVTTENGTGGYAESSVFTYRSSKRGRSAGLAMAWVQQVLPAWQAPAAGHARLRECELLPTILSHKLT